MGGNLCSIDYTQIQTDMKKILIVVMACYAMNARSQVDESRNFVYLYSDSVVYAKKVILRPDGFGSWQLRADSKRIPRDRIKFFNSNEGFFANTRKLNFVRTAGFSERIIEGKINLFQQTNYDPMRYEYGYGFSERRQQPVDVRMYYNKGYGDLKKVGYSNLKMDMSDNAESMRLLDGYRKTLNTSKALYTAAGVSIIAGLVSFLVKGNETQLSSDFPDFGKPNMGSSIKKANFTGSFLLLGLGAGLAVGGVTIHSSASKRLENAVNSYNR